MTLDAFLRKYRIRSTTVLSLSLIMLWRVSEWGMMFARTSNLNGMEIAAILAAVQVPATCLAGYAFKIFQTTKSIP